MWSCSWTLQNKKIYKTTRKKRLFVQYKQVFIILHLKIPSVRMLTLLKPHILAFTLLQTSWKVIVPLIFVEI